MAIDTKGDVYSGDLTNLSNQEMEEQAEIFSEGSPVLKETLKLLWAKGHQTIGCCSGHEGQEYSYVSFYADKMTDGQVRKILTELFSDTKNIADIIVSKGHYFEEFGMTEKDARPFHIAITFEKGEDFDSNNCYQLLKSALENSKPTSYYEEKFATLNEEDKELIEDSITLKNTDFSKLKLSELKDVYKHFPNDMNCIQYDFTKTKNKITYKNDLTNYKSECKFYEYSFEYDGVKRTIKDGEIEFVPTKRTSHAQVIVYSNNYLKLQDIEQKDFFGNKIPMPDIKLILNSENDEVVEISDEEIKKRELISVKEYDEKIDELRYSKDNFRRFAQMAKEQQKERDSDEMSIE